MRACARGSRAKGGFEAVRGRADRADRERIIERIERIAPIS